ncbi:MAG: ATP-dependent helicase/nuclease subunit B [Alphaproteobacteria bacterium]|jgi:ATP-dependent helicase/nuclease subunit B
MQTDIPNFYNIPAGIAFSHCLAQGIMQQYGDQPELFAKMTIFVPSKPSIKTLRDAFLKVNHGKVLLLPKIRALGEMLEDEMVLLSNLELSQQKPINNNVRHLALTRLIIDTFKNLKKPEIPYQEAVSLASSLLELIDSLNSERVSSKALHKIDVADYDENWQKNLEIAHIVTDLWPDYLAKHIYSDPIVYRNIMLNYLTEFWTHNPTNNPVIVAGSTGLLPASADFIKLIAHAPNGCVVLAGLDTTLTQADIADLRPDHPQHDLYKLIHSAGGTADKVQNWHSTQQFLTDAHIQRQKLCHEIMRPSGTAEAWFNINDRLSSSDIKVATDQIKIIQADNDRKEASAIALIIREAMETPHKTVALITPSRILVQRVKAMLSRWKIIPHDMAGTLLSDLPQGVYCNLICDVLKNNFAPIPLLALLKHSFTNGGRGKGQFKAQIYRFEKQILRGVVPQKGLISYRNRLVQKRTNYEAYPDHDATQLDYYRQSITLIDYLERIFTPLTSLDDTTNMADFISAFTDLIAELTPTDTHNCEAVFWGNDAGRSTENLLGSLVHNSGLLGEMPKQAIYRHLKSFLSTVNVRQNFGYNPQIMIWGTSDARLKQADIVIMSGLTEGSWPIAPNTGIWLSRPMRQQLNLPSPEHRIGIAAHDFVQAFCSATVFLTHSTESNGSPNIPSRWLIRLKNILKGLSESGDILKNIHNTSYLSWVDRLDATHFLPQPATRPAPMPPLKARPKMLSVTEAEKWLRDPYAIYGKYILNLRKLRDIDQELDPSEKGTIIHQLFYDFVAQTKQGFDGKPHEIMDHLLDNLTQTLKDRPILYTFWGQRLRFIGKHFVDFEIERRKHLKPVILEDKGEISFATSQGNFTLKARCDRIDVTDQNEAIIVDYKSSAGSAHSYEQMKNGLAPQLPLQAMMIQQGGFGKAYALAGANYIIVHDTKIPPFEVRDMKPKSNKKSNEVEPNFSELVGHIFNDFKLWVEKYNDINTAYTSRRLPQYLKYDGDYDLLARVKEWNLSDNSDHEDSDE